MQAITSSRASSRSVAPAAHRGVTTSPMIRINIKDGQISSRRFHPTSHQQNETQHKGAAALLPGHRRQRVIASSSAAAGGAAFNADADGSKSNYTDCTISLTKAIIGAGQWSGGCTPSSSKHNRRNKDTLAAHAVSLLCLLSRTHPRHDAHPLRLQPAGLEPGQCDAGGRGAGVLLDHGHHGAGGSCASLAAAGGTGSIMAGLRPQPLVALPDRGGAAATSCRMFRVRQRLVRAATHHWWGVCWAQLVKACCRRRCLGSALV